MTDETPGVESWTPADGAERLAAALGGHVLAPRPRITKSGTVPDALLGKLSDDDWTGDD